MSGLVYSYLRFSDPRQAAGHSAERQMQYALRWAEEHGLRLDESLSLRDEGLSAYHQQHVRSGALGTFLAAVEAGRIAPGSVLVVEGLDRLSRAEPIQAQAQLAQIINAGISVVTASDGRVYSRESLKAQPMDLVYSLLVMIRAHEESDTKSKRVLASIRRQCEGWIAGTYRGLVRNGKDPAWLRREGDAWQLIPERVQAVRTGLALYRRGYSATRILSELTRQQLSLTGRGPQALQIYRLIRQRALVGEKEMAVDGQTYRLPDYYPALLTEVEWSELQALADDRGRRKVKGTLPHVISGMRITVCGYCGRAMVGQHLMRRGRREDGGLHDGQRRLHCVSHSHGDGACPVGGSTSVAPIERAIMSYCSDMINLQALYGHDRSEAPRAALATARARAAEVATALERLTDAMLQSDGAPPATFVRRARELEQQQESIESEVQAAERALAAAARNDLGGMDARWRALVDGVEAQDVDARLQARGLVADTFSRIVVYRYGVVPDLTPEGLVDVLLVAKGGGQRLLRIDRKGRWVDGEVSTDSADPGGP